MPSNTPSWRQQAALESEEDPDPAAPSAKLSTRRQRFKAVCIKAPFYIYKGG